MPKHELEQKLEDRCVAKIEALGGMALKLSIPGVRGFPDRLVFLAGCRVWAPEFKRLKTGRASAQQYEWKRRLAAVDVNMIFIDTDAQFDAALEKELAHG